MIVNYKEDGWQIISQRAHGLLSGQVCFHWKQDFRPERWLETIIATTEHDDAFNEFFNDDLLLNENGGPVNFKMRKFDAEKCEELLQLALSKSRYIALLTSQHIQFLYQKETDKQIVAYCKKLEKWDKKWRKESGLDEKEIKTAYQILEWCDAFSLLICQNLVPPEGRKIEVSRGPDDCNYELSSPEEGLLNVTPWPFDVDSFKIFFESKTMKQLKFDNVIEFREKLKDAPVTLHTYLISR
ncbi:DUF3891 family protein [Dyadobacter sp. CY107]|uniref:DUF3891 family protein n=1 Tax=Dyadobacter fanqingshengii TaxID=2906443 RepID=UPI001F300FEE|nr:DUF3891 family protein [Dyadobacter fanqingshengii]MCF2506202.1 DUF3891 family protein [Dyadobacter fanqingshengii]